MSDFIPISPPRNSGRKKGKREYEGSAIETLKCANCREEFRKHNCTFCNDNECHDNLFHDWITYKYRDDPSMLHVSKNRWRFVLHSEYFQLANFRQYTKMRNIGESTWPHNIYDRGTIPHCLYTSLERFIKEVYSKQAKAWFRNRIDNRLLDEQTKKEMMSKTRSEIDKGFTKMIKERNRELANCNNNELPEVAKTTKGMATHKINTPF